MEFNSISRKSKYSITKSSYLITFLDYRLNLDLGIQQLLNNSVDDEFEELLFWGKIIGMNKDYYIAMGIKYSDKYEFPEKSFYWALSSDFVFKKFDALNDYNKDHYDGIKTLILGDPKFVHRSVEPVKAEGEEEIQEE